MAMEQFDAAWRQDASTYLLVALLRTARILWDEFTPDSALHHALIGISIPGQMRHEFGP